MSDLQTEFPGGENVHTIHPSTFSIVACDLQAREWGIAVQSKFFAPGVVVPWARAEIGAVATQAHANMKYGPDGLELLEEGLTADEVVKRLVSSDDGADHRQLAVVDAEGRVSVHTGEECNEWAGHRRGEGYSCQGNILAGPAVVEDMADRFEQSEGRLADRLVSTLQAGQAAGGDRRGQQGAALLVVREGGSYGGALDRYIDLRVDDHDRPIDELERLLQLFYLYFERPETDDLLQLQGEVARQVTESLHRLGYDVQPAESMDDSARKALDAWVGVENFEERMREPGYIDPGVLEHLKNQARGT